MTSKDKYKQTLLTSPNLSTSSSYLGAPTYKAGAGTGGGGGSSWGPTKPIPKTGMIGAQSTGTPSSGSSQLTKGPNLTKPSQAWQDYGKTMTVNTGTDGKTTVTSKPKTTPSDTSATGTTGTQITSPAGQAYMQNQLNDIRSQALNIQSQIPGAVAMDEWKNSPEYRTYLKYKRDQENPGEQSNLQNSMKILADIQSEKEKRELEARREYEEKLDKSGGTVAAAQQGAALSRRMSNQELADLALRESAAARTAGVYQAADEANKKEGFSLGENQTRYEYNPDTGSYEAVGLGGAGSGGGMGGGYAAGSNPTIDSYIKAIQDGTAKISDVPNEYKDMVMQGLSSTQKPQSEISKQAINVIGELLANPKLDRIFGPADQFVGGVFGDAALAKNKYDQLKGLLSLDNIKYLKGTGAISDAEQRLLANAASALGRNLGNEQARQVLTQLRDDLTALQGQGGQSQGGDVIQTSAGPVNTNW